VEKPGGRGSGRLENYSWDVAEQPRGLPIRMNSRRSSDSPGGRLEGDVLGEKNRGFQGNRRPDCTGRCHFPDPRGRYPGLRLTRRARRLPADSRRVRLGDRNRYVRTLRGTVLGEPSLSRAEHGSIGIWHGAVSGVFGWFCLSRAPCGVRVETIRVQPSC